MEHCAEPIIVLCSFPDADVARQIGTVLVEKQYAACVSLLPGVVSLYRWDGKLESNQEVIALIKTTKGRYADLEKEILSAHPYEVPEIISIPVNGGLPSYLQWLATATSPQ